MPALRSPAAPPDLARLHPIFRATATAPRIGSILLLLDHRGETQAVTRAAAALAARFGARLLAASFSNGGERRSPTSAIEAMVDRLLQGAEKTFTEVAAQVNAGATWCAQAPGALAGLGWAADLIVAGMDETLPSHRSRASLRRLMAGVGRPVLLQPARAPSVFDRIVLVWNGDAASRRAVSAALPFLAQARSATVLTNTLAGRRARAPLRDLHAGLNLRGVDVEIAMAPALDRADLMSHAFKMRPDLVVTGAPCAPWLLHDPFAALDPAPACAVLLCP